MNTTGRNPQKKLRLRILAMLHSLLFFTAVLYGLFLTYLHISVKLARGTSFGFEYLFGLQAIFLPSVLLLILSYFLSAAWAGRLSFRQNIIALPSAILPFYAVIPIVYAIYRLRGKKRTGKA